MKRLIAALLLIPALAVPTATHSGGMHGAYCRTGFPCGPCQPVTKHNGGHCPDIARLGA